MLFILVLLLVATVIVLLPRLRVPGGVNASSLGSMSQQWVAEQRASRQWRDR
jgi:hypothetical protein